MSYSIKDTLGDPSPEPQEEEVWAIDTCSSADRARRDSIRRRRANSVGLLARLGLGQDDLQGLKLWCGVGFLLSVWVLPAFVGYEDALGVLFIDVMFILGFFILDNFTD